MAMLYQAIIAQCRIWPLHCRQPPCLPMGWTFAVTTDNNKAMSVQVNGTAGGHILYPGSGNSVTAVSLAPTNYEILVSKRSMAATSG